MTHMDVRWKWSTLLSLLVVLAHAYAAEPLAFWALGLLAFLALAASYQSWRFRAFLFIPFFALISASLHFHWRIALRWPENAPDSRVLIEARVLDTPEQFERGQRFVAQVNTLDGRSLNYFQRFDVRLSHYDKTTEVRAGDVWVFDAKLRAPRSTVNEAAFDYERWLFTHHIAATGSVRLDKSVRQAQDSGSIFSLLREQFSQQLAPHALAHRGLIEGITIGLDDHISQEEWHLFRDTGTLHLVVISGMHLTLFAGIGAAFCGFLWRRSARLCAWYPAPRVALIGGFLLAFFYAGVAGFSIPVVRALWMIFIVGVFRWRYRLIASADVITLAILGIVLVDPCAVFEPGFWLSLLGVCVLVLATTQNTRLSVLRIIKIQFLLSVAMMPITALSFGTISLISPISNFFAIPWFSLVAMPLSFVGVLLNGVSDGLAYPVLWLADQSFAFFKLVMVFLASTVGAQWFVPALSSLAWLAAALAVFSIVLPWHPWRYLGLALISSVLLSLITPAKETSGVHVFDVGQGLALSLTDGEHTLVYDTGPRTERFDTGEMLIAPYLKSRRVETIHTLWVSHGDLDHAGGAQSLAQNMPILHVRSGEPIDLPSLPCRSGNQWWIGAIWVEELYPFAARQSNAASCVVRLTIDGVKILLTGDIGKAEEKELLAKDVDLNADILFVAHHGSRGSTSEAFLDQVSPSIAIISAGFRNPHHHPRIEVIQALVTRNIPWVNTADSGDIQLALNNGHISLVKARNTPRLWRGPLQ